MEAETLEVAEEEVPELDCVAGEKATLPSINGVPKFNTFRMRGVLQGQRVSVMIDGGTSHNFIDVALLLHIIFIIPMTVNDVNLSVAFRGVSGLSS
jgi:hypothetical protein